MSPNSRTNQTHSIGSSCNCACSRQTNCDALMICSNHYSLYIYIYDINIVQSFPLIKKYICKKYKNITRPLTQALCCTSRGSPRHQREFFAARGKHTRKTLLKSITRNSRKNSFTSARTGNCCSVRSSSNCDKRDTSADVPNSPAIVLSPDQLHEPQKCVISIIYTLCK